MSEILPSTSGSHKRWQLQKIVSNCSVTIAAITIAWLGPGWTGIGAGILLALYVLTTPVLAVSFGQVLFAAIDPASAYLFTLLEGSLLCTLVVSTSFAKRWVGIGVSVLFAVVICGVTWHAILVLDAALWLIATGLLASLGLGYYILHRYLLIRFEIVGSSETLNNQKNTYE